MKIVQPNTATEQEIEELWDAFEARVGSYERVNDDQHGIALARDSHAERKTCSLIDYGEEGVWMVNGYQDNAMGYLVTEESIPAKSEIEILWYHPDFY